MKPTIDVCLSPELISLYDLTDTIVVVTDVFRATSCMVAGLAHGVDHIIPVMTVEECRELQKQGYWAAGERHALQIEGFELDNSPFSYMKPEAKGQKIAVTTTNGTRSIVLAKPTAAEILVASFSNLSATANYLSKTGKDVLVVCAGWKGRPGIEDVLFAGALCQKLQSDFSHEEDSTHMALAAYEASKTDMLEYLQRASHLKRLKNLNGGDDIPFCLIEDQFNIVVELRGNALYVKNSL